MELTKYEKQYIHNNKDLIKEENWDEFFSYCPHDQLYQFIMFEAKIDLLHKMSFIPEGAFAECDYPLGNLVIPNNIKHICKDAFQFCRTLTSIDFSSTSIEYIPEWCFVECEALKKIVLPKTCKFIDKNSFTKCGSLESINLDEVEEINKGSFFVCYSLSSIKLNKSVKLNGGEYGAVPGIFWKTPLEDIITPEEYAEEFKKNFPNADIKVV